MEIGQRVQLKFLHKPTGTITGIVDGFTMNGVTLIGLSYSVLARLAVVGDSLGSCVGGWSSMPRL